MASCDAPLLLLGEGVEHAVVRVHRGQPVLGQLLVHHLHNLTHAILVVGPVTGNLRGGEGRRGEGRQGGGETGGRGDGGRGDRGEGRQGGGETGEGKGRTEEEQLH